MLQVMGFRAERAGSFASSSWFVNPLVHKRGSRGACTVVAATTKVKPKIMRLRKDEIAQVLPWTGSGEQRLQKLGTPSTWLTRLAISLAGSVMFYNYNTMAAAMASLYWAWDPVLSTTFANTSLRLQYPYAGLWKARVLSAKVVKPVQRLRSNDVFQEIFEAQSVVKPFLKLIIGDGSSAILEMKVALPSKKNQVQVGELVEVLVLSDIKSLSRFLAVRDVYLPDMDLWLSEDPCIERPLFEELVETLRTNSSSSSLMTPDLKGRDTQSVKARLPESVDMIPQSSLDRRGFDNDNVSPEPLTDRRWRLTQLDYEEFESGLEEDPKLQALRRLGQNQKDGELQRRVQEYSSDSEDTWEQDNSNMVEPNQPEVSAVAGDYAQVPDDNDDVFYEDLKPQTFRRLGQEQKKRELPRSLQADPYGPPLQYMRMQEYGSEVEERGERENRNIRAGSGEIRQSEVMVGDEDDAEVLDAPVDSRQAEQLTTVDEFLGSGLNEAQMRVSDVELVQEEET